MAERFVLPMTRASVAAGDDVSAPHSTELSVSPDVTPIEICREIQRQSYLASIIGGQATWVVFADKNAIGVIAQQWEHPKALLNSIAITDKTHIFCDYFTQQDPDTVFARYRNASLGLN